MSRYHLEWTDRFSEYLDDELEASDRAEVEAHLAQCGACRDVLAELRDVLVRANELAEVQPPRELWDGIASVIGAPARALAPSGDPNVLVLPSSWGASDSAPAQSDGFGVRRGRLAAAAAALVAISVSATWWVANARTGAGVALETAGVAVGAGGGAEGVVLPTAGGTPPADLASELATLEEVLEVARDALDPNTVRVLERNLGVIEQAIADSRQALELDPGNSFLTEHLERMYRRKLTYLQDVVRVVQWEG
jgi:hypothetical protein